MKLADPGHYYGTQEDSPVRNPGRLICFTTTAVPGRSVAQNVCVASSTAAAVRGGAAQASFDRKLTHYRNEIGERTSDNRTFTTARQSGQRTFERHAAVTRTLQLRSRHRFQSEWAAFGVSKSFHRRWKHETPNPSPAEEGSHGSRGSPEHSSARAE